MIDVSYSDLMISNSCVPFVWGVGGLVVEHQTLDQELRGLNLNNTWPQGYKTFFHAQLS